MKEWGFKGLKSDESPPNWISFLNKTDIETGINFLLSPTYEFIGTKTTVFFILKDIREEAANVSEESYFEFTVEVIGLSGDTKKFEYVPIKKEERPRIIWAKVDSPDYLGEFNVTFVDDKGRNDYIKLPRNCSLWTNKNEGKFRINITYIPSEKTKTYLYDQSLKI